MTQQTDDFLDPTSLTRWVTWLLYVHIAISVVAVISGALEYRLLHDFQNGIYTSEEAAITAGQASDDRQRIVGIAQLIMMVASGILILKWIYRANFNARQLGAADMTFTPGWAVGWYFIPVAWLWKPYQSMKEIWKASADPAHWEEQSTPSILGWWWFLWIISVMLGQLSFRMMLKSDEIQDMISSNIISAISDIVEIPLSITLLIIVRKVHDMQMSCRESFRIFS